MNNNSIYPCGRISRRSLITQAAGGFFGAALGGLWAEDGKISDAHFTPHFEPKAKSVIFLFMEGGPSHLDTFDPKPELTRLHGQKLPASFGTVLTPMGTGGNTLLASRRTFRKAGQSGLEFSDWLPHMATCADDLCVVRSLHSDGLNHSGGVCQMNTGSILAGRPSLGAWVNYGLGTENDSLPAFVVMEDDPGKVTNGPRNWGAGFMPAVYQGTEIESGAEPIKYLVNPKDVTDERQRKKLAYLAELNRRYAAERAEQSELEARIASYELAFRMQAEAPDAVDLSQETAETKALYGLDQKETATFGRMCLLARRLVERGVRFVQLYSGSGLKWDAHSGIEKNHTENCRSVDLPTAGLLKDLKRRGLLNDTLVIWGGEFGRTPMSEKKDGRDHNPYGYTMVLAGGGVRGGRTVGTTDELGLHAVEDRLHTHDFHATLLRLLGLDHMQLVYRHKNRPERPTLNEGVVCEKIVNG
jgi:hypothetical protein